VLATLAIWLPVILLRIHQEEDVLSRRLGDAYREYARRTWRLVPGLY
jgi:protein-S-isoprenylcysteine O-methyltransferase Ste14